ncbi:MAG: hypothetical protein BWY82_02143 [Verrucomicrobia bacterium ADurb.Bin474]|nr:MAG: hypothetical protein BWY82_02143 [Verrucomicrobia bacterium ADurb.Bin474]
MEGSEGRHNRRHLFGRGLHGVHRRESGQCYDKTLVPLKNRDFVRLRHGDKPDITVCSHIELRLESAD